MKYKIIADVHCDRIVYFTDNVSEDYVTDDNLYVCYTDKNLPEDMTLKNCWNWRWNPYKEELVYSVKETTKEDLLTQNKKAVKITLQNIINTARNYVFDDYLYDDVVKNFIFRELFVEKEKQLYIHAIAEIEQKTVEQVIDEFQQKRKMFEDLLFLTEVTKRHFEQLIEKCDNNRDLYKIRNDIIATNLVEQYKEMAKENLTLIQEQV